MNIKTIFKKISTLIHANNKKELLYNFINNIDSYKEENYSKKWPQLIENVKNAKFQNGLGHNNPHIIISLTSYPARFQSLTLTLKSILLQTQKADKIIVYLDCSKDKNIPELLDLEQYGVKFRYNVENLKPHCKYFYAMQEFSDDIIITIDDDICYANDLISSLYKSYKKYPNCVSARRVHKILINDNQIESYNKWPKDCIKEKNPSHLLVATGVGGVLYPPKCLDKRTFNVTQIKEYCLTADDIWLKFMEILNDTQVVWAKQKMSHCPVIEGSQGDNSLWKVNIHTENLNDTCIKKLMSIYGDEIKAKLKIQSN